MNINPQQILLVDKIQHLIILKCKFVESTILGYTDHNFISMFDKLYRIRLRNLAALYN